VQRRGCLGLLSPQHHLIERRRPAQPVILRHWEE
jgi:hypothetical protein